MEQLEPISILLVDDRPEKLLSLEAIVTDLPVKVVSVSSGADALRYLLKQQFALILLDIDMPTMNGFETAKLIRQRRSSRDTPIIFVTAYQDEVCMARGYSLGAVDYILQPVIPEVLRSKVSVFVDLYRKTQLISQHAEWQQQRASQLQKLAAASVAINRAASMDKMLQVITDSARGVIGAHQAMTLFKVDQRWGGAATAHNPCAYGSFSNKYAEWRQRPLEAEQLIHTSVAKSRAPTRLSERQLQSHPDWEIVRKLDLPPMRGMIAVPLIGRSGGHEQNLGLIYASDKIVGDGDFSADDEAILLQLSQMAVVAIENLINVEAREANRAKDQFIAVLSHELRTPLTPVLATLTALEQDCRLPEDLREDVQLVSRNVALEARLIDDLLDLTRISKGKVELHMAPVDAHDLVRRALSICKPDILDKELKVTIRLGAEQHFVLGDATRLQQVLWNLIKNAIKFTSTGGDILVASANLADGGNGMGGAAGGPIEIAITDSGIGIDAEVLPRIFTAFEQGTSSITRQFGGLGLGLAISKAIVERHQGVLKVQSPGAGQGATFTLNLPVTAERPAKPAEPRPIVREPDLSHARRILFVEDHRDTARVMTRLLRGADFQVDWASTMAEGIELAAKNAYDLLISDIGLPDGSGLELIRRVREIQAIPGIALSGFGMEDDVRRSKEAGFAVHLTKPLDFKLLVERIQELTSRAPAAEKMPV